MFTANLRVKVIHIALIAVVFSSALTPNETLAKASFAQSDPAYSSADLQTESSLAQTPDVLIQCIGSLSACSDVNPNTTVTETIDFTNDDRRIEFKILCEGWNCPKRDIYYSVTMDVEWGNGIDAPWFFESATLTTSPTGSGGFINMPCGGGLSGSCTLSTAGVISAENINPDPDASWHFAIENTGGTSASGEWHHRVLNITVSLVEPSPTPTITPTPSGCVPDTFEPDDSLSASNPIILGEEQRHSLCPQNDEDWVSFQSNITFPGQRNFLVETFDLEPDSINPNGNTQLTVTNASGNQIGTNQDRGFGPPPGSNSELESSRVVWHPATNEIFNIRVFPQTPINEQAGSGYSLRLANPFTSVDPVDQASWGPTRVSVPAVWRNGNIIYFMQYFAYEQTELDALNAVPATLAWEFRRPAVNPSTGEEVDESNVDFGDYWQSIDGVCDYGRYWTNLPNHSHRYVEESNWESITGCEPNNPSPFVPKNEEFEVYIKDTTQLVADKVYYIVIKFYIHDEYLNSDYQFYITKAEYCERFLEKFDIVCNIRKPNLAIKQIANLIEGYLQPAP